MSGERSRGHDLGGRERMTHLAQELSPLVSPLRSVGVGDDLGDLLGGGLAWAGRTGRHGGGDGDGQGTTCLVERVVEVASGGLRSGLST